MAHEHFLKEHIYLHTASGDTPVLEYRRLRSPISKLVTSRRFQKWGSSGVVSAFLLRKTIDFTGFWGTFQDTAVTNDNLAKGVKGVLDMHFVGFIFGHGNSPSLIIVRGGSTPCCRPLIAYQQRRAGLRAAARMRRLS